MARHWDEDDEETVIDAAVRVIVVSYSIERILKGLRAAASGVLRRARHARPDSISVVSGLPCAADFAWTGDNDGEVTRPALTHAARIPPDVQTKIDRGGE